MPFSRKIRETALVKSKRYCCICNLFAGRDAVVHHIIQEADGGANTLDNAIVLCSRCHSEAGHYNPYHPLGTKYSPNELRKHRDLWWQYCESFNKDVLPEETNTSLGTFLKEEYIVVEKEVGTLSSNFANVPIEIKKLRFRGRLIAEYQFWENSLSPHSYELYQISGQRYVVYHRYVYRGDYEYATLAGVNEKGLTLNQVQKSFPSLATEAGLSEVINLNF